MQTRRRTTSDGDSGFSGHKREGRAHSQLKHSLGVAAAGALSILALGAAATPAIASLTLTSAGQASSDGTAVQQVFPWET
jgi:hypothetical protein